MEFKLNLSEYDLYILEVELNTRIFQIKATRDKVGISAEDTEAEPNQHIKSMENILNQLGLKVR